MNVHKQTDRELTPDELAERARLVQWMEANDYTPATLARATGDFYNNIQLMTYGNRRISQGFKWRFKLAFGDEAANRLFAADPATQVVIHEPA